MPLGRRQLLVHGSQLGLAASVVGLSACAGKMQAAAAPPPRDGAVELSLAQYPGLESPGHAVALDIEGVDKGVLLIHGDAGFTCVTRKCTHMGCKVNYDAEAGHIQCPCHGSQYANDGSNKKGPAKEPLTQYPVSVDGDKITISVG